MSAITRSLLWRRPRWGGVDGIANFLHVSIPLILSNAIHSLNMFMDRWFLSWYGAEEFAASMQSGAFYWMTVVLFFMTVMYAGTMAAQHLGARQERMVGPVVWQAIYLAIAAGVLHLTLGPLGHRIFNAVGHDGRLPMLEGQYFQVLTYGSGALFVSAALHSFFAFQGRTWMIMFINFTSGILNICLNAWMIFTPIWIFPAGIEGAAWATVIATWAGAGLFVVMVLARREHETRFAMLSGWRFRWDVFRRFLKYGFPSGTQGLVDMIGITVFLMAAGLLGVEAQYATNMTLNLNLLLFIPAVGMHMTLSIIGGQLCGARDHTGVERMTSAGLLLIGIYMAAVSCIYIFAPDLILGLFRGNMAEAQWQSIHAMARVLLWFIVGYTLFDVFVLVYTGTLKGAGDTRFVMWMSFGCSITLLLIPCLLISIYRDSFPSVLWGVCATWLCFSLFLAGMGTLALWRYWWGSWRLIDVVDAPPEGLSPETQRLGAEAANAAMPV